MNSAGIVSASCVSVGFTHPFMSSSLQHMSGMVVNNGDGNNCFMCHSSPVVLAWLIHVVNDGYQEHQERARSNVQALLSLSLLIFAIVTLVKVNHMTKLRAGWEGTTQGMDVGKVFIAAILFWTFYHRLDNIFYPVSL